MHQNYIKGYLANGYLNISFPTLMLHTWDSFGVGRVHTNSKSKVKMIMFLDSAAKSYPGVLRDQNKYATFDILANPRYAFVFRCDTVYKSKLVRHVFLKSTKV